MIIKLILISLGSVIILGAAGSAVRRFIYKDNKNNKGLMYPEDFPFDMNPTKDTYRE